MSKHTDAMIEADKMMQLYEKGDDPVSNCFMPNLLFGFALLGKERNGREQWEE